MTQNNLIRIKKGTPIVQSLKEQKEDPYTTLGVLVEGQLTRLDHIAQQDGQAELLTIRHKDGYRIYYHTVTALFFASLHKLYPDVTARVEHFIGKSLYIAPKNSEPFTTDQLQNIETQMRSYIAMDQPLLRKRLSYEEAMAYFHAMQDEDKIRLYETIQPEHIDGIFIDNQLFCFHNYLAPSAVFVGAFALKSYYPGVVLQFPLPDQPERLAPFVEQRALARTYQTTNESLRLLHLESVGEVNEKIQNDQCRQLIQLADTRLEHLLYETARHIVEDDHIRLILIAGPSASGKTTIAKKLAIHMGVMGKFPVTVSMDDYFVDRTRTPKDRDGSPNFESTKAIDTTRFNHDMLQLLEGKEVTLPHFDFLEGKSTSKEEPIRIDRNHPIIVEGIHGLNPLMTQSIPEKNKWKIYISALTQLNIDNHNRISTTDVRFLRRMVRDAKFRGHDALRTFELWKKVRISEDAEIFPFQEESDVSIDTSLVYEVFVLKGLAEAILKTVPVTSEYWVDAKRLLRFLDYFLPMEEDCVPSGSLLREFIGGNSYEGDMQWI